MAYAAPVSTTLKMGTLWAQTAKSTQAPLTLQRPARLHSGIHLALTRDELFRWQSALEPIAVLQSCHHS